MCEDWGGFGLAWSLLYVLGGEPGPMGAGGAGIELKLTKGARGCDDS